jgi:4-amino-4-deoxy-L-arabinose transferase-like glycosyltransferase
MFDADIGGQIAWLLPAALGAIVIGFVLARGGGRTNRQRDAFLLWSLWLVVTAVVFSLMGGIFHAYYTVALAPAVGALVGQAGSMLWWYRQSVWARLVLAVGVLGTSALAVALLARSAEWLPWLRVVVLVAGVVAAAALVILPVLTARTPVLSEEMAADGAAPPTVAAPHRVGPAVIMTGALAVFAVLAAPAAYAMQTSSTPHTGSIPSAGPAVTSGFGRGPQWGMPGGPQAGGGPFGRGGPPQLGQGPGQRQGRPGQQSQRGRAPGGSRGAAPGGPGRAGTAGNGLLQAPVVNSALVAALEADANSYRWVAATIGANGAAGYQLAARQPVMAIGGFNGSDPSPTLEQFQAYVAAGDIHYYLGGDGFRSNGGSDEPSRIAAWVQENFTPTSIGGDLAYDLTQPLSGVGESS